MGKIQIKLYNKYFLAFNLAFLGILGAMTLTDWFHQKVMHNPWSFLPYLLSTITFIFLLYICIDNHLFSIMAGDVKREHSKEMRKLKEANSHFKKLKRKTHPAHMTLLEEEVAVNILEKKLVVIRQITKDNLILTRNVLAFGVVMFFASIFLSF